MPDWPRARIVRARDRGRHINNEPATRDGRKVMLKCGFRLAARSSITRRLRPQESSRQSPQRGHAQSRPQTLRRLRHAPPRNLLPMCAPVQGGSIWRFVIDLATRMRWAGSMAESDGHVAGYRRHGYCPVAIDTGDGSHPPSSRGPAINPGQVSRQTIPARRLTRRVKDGPDSTPKCRPAQDSPSTPD